MPIYMIHRSREHLKHRIAQIEEKTGKNMDEKKRELLKKLKNYIN